MKMTFDTFTTRVCLPVVAVATIGALAYVISDLSSEPKPTPEPEIVEVVEEPKEPTPPGSMAVTLLGIFAFSDSTPEAPERQPIPFDAEYVSEFNDSYAEEAANQSATVYWKPDANTVVENPESELPPVRHLLKDGDGHDYEALSDREKLRLCMIIAEVTGAKDEWYYREFLGGFYSDDSNRNRDISEAAAVAAAMP